MELILSMSKNLPESVVTAFGGNALKENGPDGNNIEAQDRAMGKAAQCIAAIRQKAKKILVVHGNGPQVGWMLSRSEIAAAEPHNMAPVHLRNAVAGSQSAIGSSMARALVNADSSLRGRVAMLGTQIMVDENDPAFQNPTKPIGDFMNRATAEIRISESGWIVREQNDGPKGRLFRRVVPSPEPIGIEEIDVIKLLMDGGFVTIAVGGGGIPFILKENGEIVWVDAVIDKDAAAALAAILLKVKLLAIFTAEEGIYDPDDFKRKQNGNSSVKPKPQITVAELDQMIRTLPTGSMGPKAAALMRFANETQQAAWVGPLDDGYGKLTNSGGTWVVPS